MHGKDNYRSFGPWGSTEAVNAYRRFASEWAVGAFECKPVPSGGSVCVAEILLGWIPWVEREFQKNGKPTSTVAFCKAAATRLAELYGTYDAKAFGPDELRAVRDTWVKDGFVRDTCNAYTYWITRCFAWAVSKKHVPSETHAALLAVETLLPGRTTAPDRPRKKPADSQAVAMALAHLRDDPRGHVIRVMVNVQRLTGMRPQHLCEMRLSAINNAEDVWVYSPPPSGNKTHHRGIAPRFYFGPQVQALLFPLLDGCGPDEFVFAWTDKAGKRHSIRRDAYGLAVGLACRDAGMSEEDSWRPHQLRHALATEVAKRSQSLERAAAAIGDTVETLARHYVALDPKEVMRREIAREHG
jgi:integrase